MNIYVGNLPFGASEDELRQMFAEFGQVSSVSIIKDHITGQSRGFAFVEMPDGVQGQAAITGVNGKPMGSRPLKVNEARPKGAGAPTGERRPSSGGYSNDRSSSGLGSGGYTNDRGGGFGNNDRGGFGATDRGYNNERGSQRRSAGPNDKDRDRRGGSGRNSW